MSKGFITSIRDLLERVDANHNLEITSAINTLQREITDLMAEKEHNRSVDLNYAFSDIFSVCINRLTFKTKMNISLYEYFKNGGVITKAITSNDLIKELANKDPISKKTKRIVAYNGLVELEGFKKLLSEIQSDYSVKTPVAFVDKDFLCLKLSEIENGVYWVNESPVLVIHKKANPETDSFPDYLLKVSKEEIVIYFHHPIEDVWILNDGTAFFNGLTESIIAEYGLVIQKACSSKKAFNFKKEMERVEKKCIEICKVKNKLPAVIKDQTGNVLYRANTESFTGTEIQDSIVFCFHTENVIAQISVSVIGKESPTYHTKITYLISAYKLLQSIDESAIPIRERVMIVSAANQFINLVNQQFNNAKK